MKKALVSIIVILVIFPVVAHAVTADEGNIAVIEDVDGTILDGFSAMAPNVFLGNVACAFYQTHPDAYDTLIVFNTAVSNVQQGWSTKNTIEGIGRPLFNWNNQFCANQDRLRITVNMGNINTLPPNPDDIANIVLFYPLTGMELLAHEFGHKWLAAVTYDKGDGNGKQCLLRGYEPNGSSIGEEGDCSGLNANDFNQHWSYNYNSCSVMYGSCIEDLGDGHFHFSYPWNTPKYSPLDQYLMGLRTIEEVPPMFLVRQFYSDGSLNVDGTSSIPISHNGGGDHDGERVDVLIEDIIRSEGPRNHPELDNCHWKAAFILVHPAGQPPFPEQIGMLEAWRARWEQYYDWVTDNRGSFDTTLDGCGLGTANCIGEQSPQCGQEPGECINGQQRCNGLETVEFCREGNWIVLETCPGGLTCQGGQCLGDNLDGDVTDGDTTDGDSTDGDLPTDGDTQDGDITDGDASDGDAVDGDMSDGDATDGDAVDGDVTDGDITGSICDPGATRCNGDIFQSCNANGSNWISANCAAQNMSCDTAEGCMVAGTGNGCSGTPGVAAWLWLALAGLLIHRRSRLFR